MPKSPKYLACIWCGGDIPKEKIYAMYCSIKCKCEANGQKTKKIMQIMGYSKEKMLEDEDLSNNVGKLADGLRKYAQDQAKQIEELQALVKTLRGATCAMIGCGETATTGLKVREDEDDSGHDEQFCTSHAIRVEEKAGEMLE